MRTGLFIGRFQPLDPGHVMMIKQCASKVDRLVIAIGSADAKPSCKNPFTAKERSEMVMRGMKEIGVRNYEVVELPDCESDEEWVKVVVERTQSVISTGATKESGVEKSPVRGGQAHGASGKRVEGQGVRSLHSARASVEMTKFVAWS